MNITDYVLPSMSCWPQNVSAGLISSADLCSEASCAAHACVVVIVSPQVSIQVFRWGEPRPSLNRVGGGDTCCYIIQLHCDIAALTATTRIGNAFLASRQNEASPTVGEAAFGFRSALCPKPPRESWSATVDFTNVT
jgi:hypothetical protein